MENVRRQLSGGAYGKIIDAIKQIEQQLINECKAIDALRDTLSQSVNLYKDCEKGVSADTVLGGTVDFVSLGLSAATSEIGTSTTTVDPSQMTYEEYLQYRIDNAVDENTKKLYQKYLDDINVVDDNYSETARYNYFWNNIKYDETADATNPRGIGCTYFHETGHLIDDQSDLFGHTSTDGSYDFYEKLQQDVDNYVQKIMTDNGYTSEADAYDDLSTYLETDPNMKNGISDLVYGLTDGEASGAWRHDADYYSEKAICREAFAHFFEAGMAADSTKLDYIKEVFPTAYEEYQKMIEDELK